MRLKNRLGRLELILGGVTNSVDQQQQTREQLRSWMDNDPEALALYDHFESYCTEKLGFSSQRKEWVELTREDPVAEEHARKFLKGFKDYVQTHYGVNLKYAGGRYD